MTNTDTPCCNLSNFSETVHRIYAASADPARWPDAVEAVARSLGGTRALLFTPLVGPQDGGLMFPWQMEDKYITLWATKYMAHDVWTHAAQRMGLTYSGALFTDETLLPQTELHKTVYFREFLSLHNVGRVCAAIIFEGTPGLPATAMSIYRGIDAPAFGAAEREWLALLIPHFSRALGLMHRLNFERHQSQSMRSALDRLTIGVLLLNDELRVTFANAAAQNVMARNDGLSLNSHGCISATTDARDGLITAAQWLAQWKATPLAQHTRFDEPINIKRTGNGGTYQLQCCALETDDLFRKQEGASYIVFVTDPSQVVLPTPEQLQKQLGLTPAESQVALSLTQGLTYRAAAHQRNVTEETLRSQVKTIYTKTRVNQKAGLARLVLSLGSAAV